VFFADETSRIKSDMIAGEPFKKLFFVDVEVSRVGGRVVSYKVVGFHGSDDVEDDDAI
jgi:hypothetical protein